MSPPTITPSRLRRMAAVASALSVANAHGLDIVPRTANPGTQFESESSRFTMPTRQAPTDPPLPRPSRWHYDPPAIDGRSDDGWDGWGGGAPSSGGEAPSSGGGAPSGGEGSQGEGDYTSAGDDAGTS